MKLSIITPTTGRKCLYNAIDSISNQDMSETGFYFEHILLWDNLREDEFSNGKRHPFDLSGENRYSIIIPSSFKNGNATGSALRAIGLMAAKGEYITFMDDDVMWEKNHISTMLAAIKDKNWAFCKRKIWTKIPIDDQYEYLGVDNFESVGEEAKTQYKMVDNSSMIFKRRFGSSAAPLYREVEGYCDDRLMYEFLMKYAGEPGKTNRATVNQVCPDKLVEFFRQNCTR